MKPCLLLIDGNSMLHRAYYALPDWRNRSGEATAGVYGFLSMLLRAVEELKPTHLAIVFDTPGGNFRHEMYVGYQSKRDKDPQITKDIWEQVEKLKMVFEKMGVPTFFQEGVEADDLAGTLVQKIKNSKNLKLETEIVIITGDKDYMQLVNEQVKLYMPKKGLTDSQVIDRDKVKEILGVWPEQVVDYKALVGDSSDNYPGVTGIGPKGAIDLISNYSNFPNIYKNLENIKETVRQKLIDGKEGGELSYKLATMKCDCEIDFDLERAVIPSPEKMVEVFKSMGYKSLTRRIAGEEVKVDDAQGSLFERL